MKAEDFYKEHYNEQWQPKDKFDKQKKQFDYYDLIDFAEKYAVKKMNYIPCFTSEAEQLCDGLHSTDWNGKCFKCGKQVFVREDKKA